MNLLYIGLILGASLIALIWAVINWLIISKIKIHTTTEYTPLDYVDKLDTVSMIGNQISKGAKAFLKQEYCVMTVFIVVFGIIILVVVDILGQDKISFRCYATVAFIVGSLTSMLCGYIGMAIAVESNFRTTFKAIDGIGPAFKVAYRGGCVMGFSSVGLGLGILMIMMIIYKAIAKPSTAEDYAELMELLAGYGLGGSAMALFGRVGGGIFTKAADVGADLVGKVENDLAEDSPRNPATIADNVGDNVGDIAGMGSDLFGSFAESTCAALVLMASTRDLIFNKGKNSESVLLFPLMISAAGIVGCLFTSIVGLYLYKVDTFERIRKALNLQLYLSTFLTLAFLVGTVFILPKTWVFNDEGANKTANRWYAFAVVGLGCVAGLLIGISTDYYTSYAYNPVREMARACSSGAAINVIYGLSLGYASTIIPIILIAITILISIILLGMLGVALAAIGMLSTLAVGLAIDAYGPIADNAGGIAEMSEMGDEIREITDALDSAGNTTAAVGKGFAIGSAALVSLALYGAFITRASNPNNSYPIYSIKISDPYIFASMLIGSMLPFAFSALTMKSVGIAAQDMVAEVRRQFQDGAILAGRRDPDYQRCIVVSTNASLREMILPGLLVLLTPLFFGILIHPATVAGLLPGTLVSAVQLAISMSNTGGAWDNCKKLIESGQTLYDDQNLNPGKGSPEHKAAVIGDTIGDPLKDTSGPSLNILIKLMAIVSLVFAAGFDKTALLGRVLNIQTKV